MTHQDVGVTLSVEASHAGVVVASNSVGVSVVGLRAARRHRCNINCSGSAFVKRQWLHQSAGVCDHFNRTFNDHDDFADYGYDNNGAGATPT